jgi:hypothetical protein
MNIEAETVQYTYMVQEIWIWWTTEQKLLKSFGEQSYITATATLNDEASLF